MQSKLLTGIKHRKSAGFTAKVHVRGTLPKKKLCQIMYFMANRLAMQ